MCDKHKDVWSRSPFKKELPPDFWSADCPQLLAHSESASPAEICLAVGNIYSMTEQEEGVNAWSFWSNEEQFWQ